MASGQTSCYVIDKLDARAASVPGESLNSSQVYLSAVGCIDKERAFGLPYVPRRKYFNHEE